MSIRTEEGLGRYRLDPRTGQSYLHFFLQRVVDLIDGSDVLHDSILVKEVGTREKGSHGTRSQGHGRGSMGQGSRDTGEGRLSALTLDFPAAAARRWGLSSYLLPEFQRRTHTPT